MYTKEVKVSTSKFPILGYTVVASMDSHLEVDKASLATITTPLGFGSFTPPEVEPKTYIKRAIVKWLKELASSEAGQKLIAEFEDESGNKQKRLVRPIKCRDKNMLALALVLEAVNLDELGLTYLSKVRIFHHKEQGQTPTLMLTLTERGIPDPSTYYPSTLESQLLNELQRHVLYYQDTYKASELNRMIQDIVQHGLNATPIRAQGGAYFVPYERRDRLVRLKELLEKSLPSTTGENTSSLLHIPIFDDNEGNSKEQVQGTAYAGLMAKAKAFQTKMNRFLTENKKGVGKKSMERRLMAHAELRAELDLYKNLLGTQIEEVEAAVDGLDEKVQELINKRAEAMIRAAAEGKSLEEEEDEGTDEHEEGGEQIGEEEASLS